MTQAKEAWDLLSRDKGGADSWRSASSLKPWFGVFLIAVLGMGFVFFWWFFVSKTAPPIPQGVEVSTTPEGAEYHLVSEEMGVSKEGKTPEIISGLPPGTYRLTIHLEGWMDHRQEVRVGQNGLTLITCEFARGALTINSTPVGVEVREGGSSLGKAPLHTELPEGTYTLTFKCPGFPDQQHGVNIYKDRPALMNIEFVQGPLVAGNAAKSMSNSRKAGKPPVKGNNFVNSIGMKLNWVRPVKGWAGVYEVTQEEYQKVMGENPSEYNGARYPVETVSWNDAMKFCSKLTALEMDAGTLPKGSKYTLPTDAQWSFLVGNASLDDAVTSLAKPRGGRGQTEPVGTKGKNNYGLYDTRGNVWEWCLDWYLNTMNDPALVAKYHLHDDGGTRFKVLRGGGWYDTAPDCLAVSYRLNVQPEISSRAFGFRCVLVYAP